VQKCTLEPREFTSCLESPHSARASLHPELVKYSHSHATNLSSRANTASPTLRDTWANLHEGDKEKWKQKSRILFREFKSNHPDVSYHPSKSKSSLARKRKPSSPRSQAKGIGVRSPLRPTGSFLDQDPAGFDHHVLTHCGPSPTISF
jgi:hypothetical protein